jgi:multicomponent Na+:H+ antiporter subunit F
MIAAITADNFLDIAGQTALVILLVSMALALWRLAKGPTSADRVIALDLISILVIAFLVAVSIHTGETTYLDVAIAYTCIAFLGTIALARFIMRGVQKRTKGQPEKKGGQFHD